MDLSRHSGGQSGRSLPGADLLELDDNAREPYPMRLTRADWWAGVLERKFRACETIHQENMNTELVMQEIAY